jgi:hypothetical protein
MGHYGWRWQSMSGNSLITLPYKDGKVTVLKGSRIKVYTQRGSIKGFLLGFDESGITVLEPTNYLDFDFHYSEDIKGKKRKIPLKQLGGFAFYPEVSYLQTNEKETDKHE